MRKLLYKVRILLAHILRISAEHSNGTIFKHVDL